MRFKTCFRLFITTLLVLLNVSLVGCSSKDSDIKDSTYQCTNPGDAEAAGIDKISATTETSTETNNN